MDNLDKRLRDDAQRIDARISPELDARIAASLRSVSRWASRPVRPRWSLWLAGGATAAAAALAVVAIVNLPESSGPEPDTAAATATPRSGPAVVFDLDSETAGLVDPLSRELENLQADLRKAERILRDDMGF